jgi:hypothetical protein
MALRTAVQDVAVTNAGSAPAASPPANYLPGIADVASVLARTDDLVVMFVGGQAYPQGVIAEVRLSMRPYYLRPPADRGGMLSRLLLMVEFSDGRRGQLQPSPGQLQPLAAASAGHRADLSFSDVLVLPRGGSGGSAMWQQEIWISPLPSAGRLRIGVAASGLEETWTELSADDLRSAAERAEILWPESDPLVPVLDASGAPGLPKGGAPPADPVAAEQAVRHAFLRAFTATGTPGSALEWVQDGAVLTGAAEQARLIWPLAAATMRVALGDVAFLDPVRAAVQYQLSWDGATRYGPQLGYAVFEDGGWKVARQTYCALLGWAGVSCPPPPPRG